MVSLTRIRCPVDTSRLVGHGSSVQEEDELMGSVVVVSCCEDVVLWLGMVLIY